jgi:hypothetical protein
MKIRAKRPILRKKDIVRLNIELLMRKREDRLKKILELLGKRESICIIR